MLEEEYSKTKLVQEPKESFKFRPRCLAYFLPRLFGARNEIIIKMIRTTYALPIITFSEHHHTNGHNAKCCVPNMPSIAGIGRSALGSLPLYQYGILL